ncbi:MAG: hypothetical protein HYY84_08405 [Deltaproteobacteria bacterium]|nr:hypothetical protein [Deltaproteobacteria bacterium]
MKGIVLLTSGFVFTLMMGASSSVSASSTCTLSKGAEAVPHVERNLATLEKTHPAKATEIRGWRAELQTLAQKGDAFNTRALPIEVECQSLVAEIARVKAAYEKLELDRRPLRDRIARLRQIWDSTILPRKRGFDAEVSRYRGAGCGRTFNMRTEAAAYHRCEAWRVNLQGRIDAHKAETARIRSEWSGIDNRIRTLGDEYRRAYDALRARQSKYRTLVGGYRTDRTAWESQMRQLLWTTNGLLAEAARRAPSVDERRAAIKKLKGQVAGLQAALRRLNRSMLSDAVQRAEWEKATDEAMKNAWDRGKGMVVDEGLGFLGRRLETQLASANQEIQRAVTVLSGEKDPARRERLHAAVRLLGQQRDEVKRAQRLVVDRLADAKKVADAVDYGTSNPGDLEKSLKGVFSIVTTTLGDAKVQKALKVGGGYAAGAGYAQSIVESSLDITTEIVAWRRINQLNRNSDAYLRAVNRMKQKMEKTVKKIEALENSKPAVSRSR